jgi:putative transposase
MVGQAHDNPQRAPLVADYTAAHGRRFRLLADKGYAHDSTRSHPRKKRIAHTIPERSHQIAHRKAQASRGGRPAFDPMAYRHRNTVERGFNRLKQWPDVDTGTTSTR